MGDVARRTILAVRERQATQAGARPIALFSAAYGIVCVVTVAAAYVYLGRDVDPMGSFFYMASGIAP